VLIPSAGGVFEVHVDETLVFSKKALERHAEPGEVRKLVADIL
tara:strand:+ start:418 stop:546 length:129 start_codon:yes stop_codon:yes gene_type:complete